MCAAMLVSAVGVGGVGAATAKTVSVDTVASLDESTADSTATLTAYNVEDADGIGSYELNISYDDSLVDVSVSGNSRFNVETTDQGNGKLTVVGYTGETSGSTGNISLADLTVTAQSVGSDTSASIDVTVESITDTRGNLLSHSGDTTTVDVNNVDGSTPTPTPSTPTPSTPTPSTPTPSTPTTEAPSSGGGGGDSSDGGSAPDRGTYDSVWLFYDSQISASLPDGSMVTNVDIAFGSQAIGEVVIRERASLPETVGQPSSPALSFVQIDVPGSLRDSASTITLSVRQDRLDELGITAQDLAVERYNDESGEWETLDTRVVSEGDGRVVLEVDTPGFSYFAVTSTQAVTTTADDGGDDTTTDDDGDDTTTDDGTSGFDDETTTGEPTTTDSVIPGFGVTAALIALVAIALIAVRRE
ncbi:PGF-CTERM sorting domain-containing protein [Haloferax sp. Atlit-6N]|nr:PGF-CTERM sorting domain-containing protein [Haloferax sp. Atlit-6N]